MNNRLVRILSGVALYLFCFAVYCSAQSTYRWELRHQSTTHFTDIAFFDNMRGIVTMHQGVLVTNDAGLTWAPLYLNTGTNAWKLPNSIAILDSNTAWVCGFGGSLFRTTDGGATFEDHSLPEEYNMESIFFIDSQTGWMAGDSSTYGTDGKSCILKTTDGGSTWNIVSIIPPVIPPVYWIYWWDIHFVDPLNGWAVGMNGGVGSTTDGGNTWTLHNPANYPPGKLRDVFAVYAFTPQHVLVGGEYGFFYETTDGGTTWVDRKSSLDSQREPIIWDIKMYSDGSGWIGLNIMTSNVYRTEDAGVTWLPDMVRENKWRDVRAITRTPDGRIWVITEKGEILERVMHPPTTIHHTVRPQNLALNVYPLPVSPGAQLTLNVDLPEAMDVTLDLYGLHGRKLLVLHEGRLEAGTHTLRAGTLSLTPGVYIAKLLAGSEVRIAKVLVAP